jgi:hypothetical protein
MPKCMLCKEETEEILIMKEIFEVCKDCYEMLMCDPQRLIRPMKIITKKKKSRRSKK